eukprot:TRINITY_DN35029_c0_g1_i1.p3 TRINITY_DN35029_c0_g1~~TRINITY_DN35029_c0_g1_i1.p3  ORF type:complete len:396 (-),score=52.69 TRINITY_DN35029_c0_g1_i1:1105-2292(-)
MKIKIGSKVISHENKPYFIADIASNHDGDINRAYKLIELAKEAGADAAKFQNFKANTIISKNGFDSMEKQLSHQSSWQKSVYEVYKDASIADEWTILLKNKCEEMNIEYMTSPYNFEAVDMVYNYVNAYKIGSGDITWTDMLEYVSKKNKPILLATGASNFEDVNRAVECIKKNNKQLVLMQCNTNYTANIENYKFINLNVLNLYKYKFPECILGLSDHTYGHTTVLGAIALGARVIEKHFTDDNYRTGPDHKFSMNPSSWKNMVKESEELFFALGDGIKKIEENEKDSQIVQQRALYVTKTLERGHILTKKDLFPLRPINGDGIPPYEIEKLIGKTINKKLMVDSYIRWEDMVNDQRSKNIFNSNRKKRFKAIIGMAQFSKLQKIFQRIQRNQL